MALMKRPATLRLRSWLSLLWLALLLVAALLLPGRIWTTLLTGLGGLFLVAFVWAWQLARGLRAQRRLRFGWVSVGDRLAEAFTLANDSVLPAFWVEIEDGSNVPGYRPAVVRSVGGRGILQWQQDAICQQRGQFHLGPWWLRSGDPFGLFTVTIDYPISDEIIIHPPIHTQLPIPLPAGQSSGRVRARQRSWQATVNAATVRDYHPEDPFRWIHWPTTARRDELSVREFDLDAAGDIWLLLDLQAEAQIGSGPDGSEEQMILLAAALSARALHETRAIGLAAYGQEPLLIPPGQGGGQQWRLLRALALARADGESGLAEALHDLRRVAQRGSAAAILTPRGDAGWLPMLLQLSHAGVRCHVTLLDRQSFGDPASPSHGLRAAIQRLGITCHLVRQGEVGRPLAESERRGFWQFRTLATGKVVVVQRPEGR
jgi:uncharacterized protein (DUF58 family)